MVARGPQVKQPPSTPTRRRSETTANVGCAQSLHTSRDFPRPGHRLIVDHSIVVSTKPVPPTSRFAPRCLKARYPRPRTCRHGHRRPSRSDPATCAISRHTLLTSCAGPATSAVRHDVLLAANLTETDWQARVADLGRWRGWRVHYSADSRRSTAGWPDLVMVRRSRLVIAELKTATGRVTAEQRRWLAALAAVPGVEAYLWRPKDWAVVERLLA